MNVYKLRRRLPTIFCRHVALAALAENIAPRYELDAVGPSDRHNIQGLRMNRSNSLLTLALVAIATIAGAGHASAYSDRIRKACAGDYQNFCSQYVPESTQARRCFESNGKSLSRPCVKALVDAGQVPAKYLKR